MFPSPPPLVTAPESAFVASTIAPVVTSVDVAASSVDGAALRPFSLAIGATIAALVVGVLLLVGGASFARAMSDDVAERPDLAFAAGFVVLFGPLVLVALPLLLSTSVEHPAIAALTAVVSLPVLLRWGLALVVGSCLGAVALGDRLAGRITGSRSLLPAVVVGAVAFGASQLVPVFGAVVAMGLATVAIGAVVRRRFDVDERLFDGVDSSDGDEEEAAVRTSLESDRGWNTDPDRRGRSGVSGGRSDLETGDRGIGATEKGAETDEEWTDDHRKWETETDEEWTVDRWEWESEPERDDGGDEPRAESVDETRAGSVDDEAEEEGEDRRTW